MRALIIAAVVVAASTAHAAPWSFELPAGYTEEPGVAEAQLARLRTLKTTVSVDAQVFMSADKTSQLTRMTWLTKLNESPTKPLIESMDRGVVAGAAKQAGKHVSDERHWVGDQLFADTIDETSYIHVHQRRIYAADTTGVVTVFTVICAGAADQLADCEKAQQTMQLKLPHEMALLATDPPKKTVDLPYVIGEITGFAVVALVVVWWVVRRWKRAAP